MENRFLMRVVLREIKTYYTVSEMLECGHRFESLTLLADSLTAKHRVCAKCAQAVIPLPPKKPPISVPLRKGVESQSKVSGGRYDPPPAFKKE